MRLSISLMIACVALFAMGYVERAIVAARQSFGTGREEEPPLPEGVVAVEWLESDGNQNVTIGTIYGADLVSVIAESEDIPLSGMRKLCGIGWNANGQDDVGIGPNGWNNNVKAPCSVGSWHEVSFDRKLGRTFVDGIDCGPCLYFFFTAGVDAGKTFVLFCGSRGTGPYKSATGNYMPWIGRIGRVRISGGGETIRDLIPVRVGEVEEAEGFFYDLVSGEFFGNGGTGKLGIGDDL